MAVVTITATGAGTWTAPVGVVAIVVECWGGGGAGGQRSSNNSGAGGGGGGSYARVNAMAVTGSTVYSYTVGIGGTDGATPVNGGTTTFTGDAGAFCAAPGATSVTANSQTATAGAVAVNGDNVRNGGAGANGTATISGGGGESGSPNFAGFNAAGVTGGTGRVDGGDGGNGRTTTSADGFAGIQPGGGGGGGFRTTGTTRAGGVGGAGQIRITYTAYVFAATGTAYTVTGTDLHFRHSVPFDPAVYTLTGGAATLTPGSASSPIMPASPSSYAITGTAVLFTHGVPTLSAPYTLTGAPVAFVLGHGIVLAGDTYAVTGTDLTPRFGAKVVLTTSDTISTAGASQWLCPAGVFAIKVETWGGGAAGAQRSTAGGGAGGGGGEYSRRAAMAVTPAVQYNVVVGAAGTDGASPAAGGDTTFTADAGVQCVAKGAPLVAAESQTGGIGGTGGTGDTQFAGGVGANGTGALSGGGGEGGGNAAVGESGSGVTGGGGAGGAGGNGGAGKTTDSNGSPGAARGGGGGGGFQITGTRTGGTGGLGQIVINSIEVYAITGVDANLVAQVGTAKTIAASPVAYTFSGTATPLTHAIPILAEPFTEYVVSGTEVFFNYGTSATGATINGLPGSYIYNTGIASLAFTRPGDPGIYALTGTDTTLRKGFSLVGGPVAGVYSYTGQAQPLLRSFPIAAAADTYVLTGSEVSFIFNGVTTVIIPVDGETYTTTGSDLFMYAFRYLSTDEGSYPLDGADAALSTFQSEVFFITLDLGIYDLNGTAAGLIYTPANAFSLAGGAESGAYVLTGTAATPQRTGISVVAVGGSYAVTGAAVTFPATGRKIVVDSGTYVINGATFSLRRRPKPGGGFDYAFGSGVGKDSIIPQRRRRR